MKSSSGTQDSASSPKMRFVNESEEDKDDGSKDETKEDAEEQEAMDTEEAGDEKCKVNGEVESQTSQSSETNESSSTPTVAQEITTENGEKADTSDVKKNTENGEKAEASDDKKGDKPTLKLASFSSMDQPSQNSQNGVDSPVKGETNAKSCGNDGAKEDACSHCARRLTNIYQSIVWETMQFCDEVGIRTI